MSRHSPTDKTQAAARLLRALAGTTIAATTVPARDAAQGMPPSLAQFLQQTIALNQDETGAATSGKPVVKVLEPSDQREIAVFGIVRIDVPRSFYVRRAADFPSSLRNPSRLGFALFSEPAAASDVAALSFPHDDVGDLAHCRPRACKLKLSAEAIAYLRQNVDLAAPTADSVVSAYFRGRMIEYVTAYRARGDSALVVYDDEESRAAAAQVFQAMLSRSPYMYQYAPSLERYLEHYPGDRPADVSEIVFWAEDDLPGLKPTITITHEVVYAPPELPGCTLIAAKLLYADHYLDGALDLTAVVDQAGDPAAGPAGLYLVLLRRLHFDDLPSGGPMNVRGRVIGKLRDRTAAWLRDAKTASEHAYARARPSSR
jgi:hypothetical protein